MTNQQMALTGKIIKTLPVQTGTGKAGNEWKKQDIIIQTAESYPKTICITLWGNTIDDKLKQEDSIKASVDIESREFNGKWYTTIKAWKIDLLPPSNTEKEKTNEVKSSINRNDDVGGFLNDEAGELPF
jgi:hypothetical protein